MNHDQAFQAVLIVVFLLVLAIGTYHRPKLQATRESLDRRQVGLFILATLQRVSIAFLSPGPASILRFRRVACIGSFLDHGELVLLCDRRCAVLSVDHSTASRQRVGSSNASGRAISTRLLIFSDYSRDSAVLYRGRQVPMLSCGW